MMQQGQVFELNPSRGDGRTLWAYRYRTGGRTAKRIQRGGFASEQDARAALERALERLRRRQNRGRIPTLSELVEQYLAHLRSSRTCHLPAASSPAKCVGASRRRQGPGSRTRGSASPAAVTSRSETGTGLRRCTCSRALMAVRS